MSLNKVILIGRLGKDPDVKVMTSGESVANMTLATTEVWKDKSGVKQEKTEWHNLVLYRRLAEIADEYLKKGAQIYVEGKLQTRKWKTREGQDRYITEIVVSDMQMLGSKQAGTAERSTLPGQTAYDKIDIPFGDTGVATWSSDKPPF